MFLNCSVLLYKRNGKIMRQAKSGKRRGNWRGEGERRKKELFPPPVINQYSSCMLPACAIIINYTQECSWSRKRDSRGRRPGNYIVEGKMRNTGSANFTLSIIYSVSLTVVQGKKKIQ